MKKVGDIFEVCHVTANVGTFEEIHFCHNPKGSAIYEAQTPENGLRKFHLACHDMAERKMMCHPLRTGDVAFLE